MKPTQRFAQTPPSRSTDDVMSQNRPIHGGYTQVIPCGIDIVSQ
jgi:hypothetical protein